MLKTKIFLFILLIVPGLFVNCDGQQLKDRPAYAAGKFYESDSTKLRANLNYLFNSAEQLETANILAIISPHAGYVYSGSVAAIAFKQVDPDKNYKNIFVIGSSHTMPINGASIYVAGDYITPLGKVSVNKTLARKLINENKYFSFIRQAHVNEHILENQLPFLQYHLKKDFQIVPISIGTDDENVLKSIAESLKPYLNDENLFVISADFSHYPRYRDARHADSLTAKAIISNNVETFDLALNQNEVSNYPGLVTSTCGSTSIKMMLYITEHDTGLKYIPLSYKNSGDVAIGDKNRVVGYFALALVSEATDENEFLTAKDKSDLLRIARLTIDEYINKEEVPQIDPTQFSDNLLVKSGAFVTLNKNHQLRGCIGRFIADEPLYKVVQNMAISAATQDYRFQVVQPPELQMLEIEISVLTPLKKVNSIDEIELGRDGIYIVKGSRSGTFLPQVATETGWTLEEFLGHCARDKAGIGWEGWKDADIYIYQAIVFGE